ncbi:MAG: ribonuclease P protein component [Candidatus Sericytochromatia bacterium]
MLSRHERLRHQQDFDRLRQNGRSYHQPLLRLVVLKEDSLRRLAGFIVSKRISKKATDRNLLKRRLRAAYRSLKQEIPTGHLLLFVARPEAGAATYQELQAQMQTLLERAGLLQSPAKSVVKAEAKADGKAGAQLPAPC